MNLANLCLWTGVILFAALSQMACVAQDGVRRGGWVRKVPPAKLPVTVQAETAAIKGEAKVADLDAAQDGKVVTSTGTATLTFDVNMPAGGKATLEIIRFKKPEKKYDYWGYRFWRVNGKAQPIDTDFSMFRPRADLAFAELEITDTGRADGMKRYVIAWVPGLKLKKGANKVAITVPGGVTIDAIRVTPALDLELITVESAERDFIYFDDQDKAAFTIRLKNTGKEPLKMTGSIDLIPIHVSGTTIWDDAVYVQPEAPTSFRIGKVEIDAGAEGEVAFSFKPRRHIGAFSLLHLTDGKRTFIGHTHYLAVVFRPTKGFKYDSQFMMMAPQHFAAGPIWDVFEKTGFKWVRTEIGWRNCEGAKGKYNWTRADAVANEAREHNIYIMNLTEFPPAWARPNGQTKYGDHTPHPSRMAEWTEFWRKYTIRYKDVVRALNMWNEPWEHGGVSGWRSDGAHFRRLFKATYDAIHDLEPKVLLLGADSADNTDWKLLAAGYEKYVDAYSNHYAPPWANYLPALAKKNKKPVWETETWLGTKADFCLVRRCINVLAHGTNMMNIWHQHSHLRGEGRNWGPVPRGIAGIRGGPAPSIVPTNAMICLLEDTKFNRRINPGGLPFIFLFTGKGKAVAVVTSAINPGKPGQQATEDWQILGHIENGGPRRGRSKVFGIRSTGSITVDDPKGKLQAFDIYGNPIPRPDKTTLTVPISHKVVYVRSKDAEYLATALGEAKMTGIRPVEIILKDFTAPMDTLPPLEVELRSAYNVPIAGKITVMAPAGIELDRPSREFTIAEPRGRLNLAFKIKSAKPSEYNAYPFKATVETDQGVAGLEEVLNVNCVVRGTPKIDGDLSDWKALGAIPVNFVSEVQAPMTAKLWQPWAEALPGKFAARCAAMWDDKYFYFMADVQDTGKRPNESMFKSGNLNKYRPAPWEHVYERKGPGPADKSDAIQLDFDTGLWTKVKERYNLYKPGDVLWGMGPVLHADYAYLVYPTKEHGPEIFRFLREDFYWLHPYPLDYKWMAENCQVEGAKVAIKSHDTGYYYEVAIPLSELSNLEPKEGKKFRFGFQINNNGHRNFINQSAWKSAAVKTSLDYETTNRATWSCNITWGFVGKRK
ncbi:MAG: hypothetical protein QGD94_01600 [Planctomycetia bacterium]|nr:hypothetical protein [Planctomycetia bacterium]